MKGKVAIHNGHGFELHDVGEIVRMQADGNCTNVFLNSGKQLTTSQTLGYYCEQLKEEGFFRTHRGHLVNMAYITSYVNNRQGRIAMSDGSIVPVSRTFKKGFIGRFQRGSS